MQIYLFCPFPRGYLFDSLSGCTRKRHHAYWQHVSRRKKRVIAFRKFHFSGELFDRRFINQRISKSQISSRAGVAEIRSYFFPHAEIV